MTGAAQLPSISVVLPVRNEAGHIAECLDSLLQDSYPRERLEILVVDGDSDDATTHVVEEYCKRYSCVQLLRNPSRVVPHAMNIGIRAACGELIVRVDAHAHYGENYLSRLISWMERLPADNVGGVVVTRPASSAAQARAVAVILSHAFGVGNSLFRLATMGAPIEVDTVPFGCYRREIFERLGGYDEALIRNQDDEFNGRLKNAGGRIFLVPEIRIDYVARESLAKLAVMLYQYGYFKPLVAIKLGRPATWRQLAPPLFAATSLGLPLLYWMLPGVGLLWSLVVGSHSAINLAASARAAYTGGWRLFPYLFGGFLLAHLAYGIGYLRGMVDFGLFRLHLKQPARDTPLSR
jgi:glycosyltransferase involved in cell wall biosynthesis